MEDKNPTYYSINIAPVRFHETLSFGAKFMYAEIAALCNKEGYCWATNTYFSELFNVENRTIQRWLQDLNEAGFIRVDIENNHKRKIYCTLIENVIGDSQNGHIGAAKMSQGDDENVVPCNNISNSKSNTKKKPISPAAKIDTKENVFRFKLFIQDIDPELILTWKTAYPNVSINEQFNKALAWAVSNPGDAPKSAFKRFLNSWLSRAEGKEVNRKARDHQFSGDDPDRFNFKHK